MEISDVSTLFWSGSGIKEKGGVVGRGAESESESESESLGVMTSQESESGYESIKLPRLLLRNVLFESVI